MSGRRWSLAAAERGWLEHRVRTLLEERPNGLSHLYLHHCDSQGIPSLSPSIFVSGQFFRKNVASAQEVIWEQYVRPSQMKLNALELSGLGTVAAEPLADWIDAPTRRGLFAAS